MKWYAVQAVYHPLQMFDTAFMMLDTAEGIHRVFAAVKSGCDDIYCCANLQACSASALLLPPSRIWIESCLCSPPMLNAQLCVQELQKDEVPEVDEDLDSETSESTGNFVSRAVEKALSLPGLSLLKPFLIGWLTTLAANTLIAVATVAIPAVLFLVLLYSLFGGKKASSVVCSFNGLT